jgi:hypothetical protein
MARGWEYAIVTQDSERDKIDVKYAGPDKVAHHDMNKGALDRIMGALGGKDWELVSVTASWRADQHYVTEFYFKRPHDGHNHGADELMQLARDASWSSAMEQGTLHR